MLKGQLDPRQVAFTGYETKCEKIVKDLSAFAAAKMVERPVEGAVAESYHKRIPSPVWLSDIKSKISGTYIASGKGSSKKPFKYGYLNDFALDIRRIVGNFMRFNYYADSGTIKLRKDMLKILFKFETLWFDLHREIEAVQPTMYFTQPLPELKAIVSAYDEMAKQLSTAGNGGYAIDSFIDRVKLVFDADAYKRYLKIIDNQPMCYGEILSKLTECEYDSLDQMKEDVDRIVNNCR